MRTSKPPMDTPIALPEPPPVTPAPRGRWRRRVLVALAILGVALISVVVGGRMWLESESGGAFLRDKALEVARGAIAGTLEVGRVEVSGLLRLVLHDVRLTAPGDTIPAATIDRVAVTVDVRALASRRAVVPELEIDRPVADLRHDARGWNLLRAIEPKPSTDPAPVTPASAGKPWTIEVPVLALRSGRVTLEDGDTRAEVEAITLTASASGPLDSLALNARLDVDARAPVALPLHLDLDATLARTEAGTIRALTLRTDRSTLTLHGDFGLTPPHATLEIGDSVLAAEDFARLGGPALRGDIGLSGHAEGGLTGGRVELKTRLPEGTVALDATATLGLPGDDGQVLGWTADVQVDGVSPAALLEGLPPARVRAKAQASGRGVWPSGSLKAKFDATGTVVDRLPLESCVVAVESKGDRLRITDGRIAAAKVVAKLGGTAGLSTGNVSLAVNVDDLEATRAAVIAGLPELLDGELPEAAGTVTATLAIDGRWSAPVITGTLHAPSIRAGSVTISGLDAQPRVQSFRRPYRATAAGRLGRLEAPGLNARNLSFDAGIDDAGLRIGLTGAVNGEEVRFSTHARREVVKRGARWTLDDLDARALGLRMTSHTATVLDWTPTRFVLDPPVVLEGDLGHVTLGLEHSEKAGYAASLAIADLDVGKLPAALVRTPKPVAGVVSMQAKFTGTTDAPNLTARIDVANAAYGTFRGVTAGIDAGLVGRDATVHAEFGLPAGRAVVDVAAPIDAATDRSRFVRAHVVTTGLALPSLADLDPALAGLEGTVGLDTTVSGSLLAPSITAHVDGTGLRARGTGPLDVRADASVEGESVRLKSQVGHGGVLGVVVDAGLTLAQSFWKDHVLPPWRTLPVRGTLDVNQAVLAGLRAIGHPLDGITGNVTANLAFDGTLGAPTLSGDVRVFQLATRTLPPLDLVTRIKLDDAVHVVADVTRDRRPFVHVDATVPQPPSALLAPDLQPGAVPLDLRVTLAENRLGELLPGERAYDATVHGEFVFTGTADSPRFQSSFTARDVTLGRGRAGPYTLTANHFDGFTKLIAKGFSSGRESLDLDASLKGPLGWHALAAAVEARRAKADPKDEPPGYADVLLDYPLAGSVLADGFDLALLDGLDDDYRDVRGLMTAKLHLSGTGADPHLDGPLSITGGRVSPFEYGTLKEMKLEALFAWPDITFKPFSGAGLQGTFESDGHVHVDDLRRMAMRGEFHFRSKGMPLVKAYQTRAWIDARVDTTFEVLGKSLRANVDVSQGVLRIAEQLPRRVQDLEPNPDIVFVQGGRRVVAAGRRWKYEARIKIADDFNVLALTDTNFFLGADLVFSTRATPGRTGSRYDIVGPVRLPRGTLAFLGKRFTIDPTSRVQMLPGAWDDPQLAIRAHYEGRDDGVKVTVDVGGTPESLETRLSATPAMDQAEIVYYLTTGQRQLKAQSGTAALGDAFTHSAMAAVGSVVGGVARSVLDKLVPKEIPLDLVQVEAGDTLLETRFRAGTFVTDRLYIGSRFDPGALYLKNPNSVEVELDYRIADDFSGRAKVGNGGQSGVELLYQRDFWAPEQKHVAPK